MRYVVNKRAQPNGDHEVHELTCPYVPDPANRHALGDFASCAPAVQAAKKVFAQSNGCRTCSLPCHTT